MSHHAIVRLLAFGVLLALVVSGTQAQSVAARVAPWVQHSVVFGETLADISQLTDTSVSNLAEMNFLTRGDLLVEGQQLNLHQPLATNMVLHRVAAGETLSAIAATYSMSRELLAQMNQLSCTACLIVGQSLRVLAKPSTDAVAALPFPLQFIRVTPTEAIPGDVLILRVATQNAISVEGSFAGKRINFAHDPASLRAGDARQFIGLIGIDGLTKPDHYDISIVAKTANGTIGSTKGRVHVQDDGFVTERVTLPQELVATLDIALSQVEEAQVKAIYSQFTPRQYWNAPFRLPVRGKLLSQYGNHRIYNGIDLGTYHSGYDLSAVAGTPVAAAAPGRVAFVQHLYIRGNSVIVDHGRGVFTGYFHMRQTNVQVGQMVDTNDTLGEVGTTGRSQGNHIHFDLAVGGITVDPGYWTETALP